MFPVTGWQQQVFVARKVKTEMPYVLTIEQSARTWDVFLDLLPAHEIERVIDVHDRNQIRCACGSVAVPPGKWDQMTVSNLMDRHMTFVSPECDMREALRLLTTQGRMHMLRRGPHPPIDHALE